MIATDVLDFEGFDEGQGWDAAPARSCERHLDVTDAEGWTELAAWFRRRTARCDGAGQQRRRGCPRAMPARHPRRLEPDLRDQRDRPAAGHPVAGRRSCGAGASIVNICSVAAVSGHAAAAYTASKWALRGLTRSASLELGSTRGIRVNAVMPGLIDTPLMASASPAFTGRDRGEVLFGFYRVSRSTLAIRTRTEAD
ncbi:MAG: SDR family NAD(P)-dependent oxidoreductase, partial [Nocardioides sp.]